MTIATIRGVALFGQTGATHGAISRHVSRNATVSQAGFNDKTSLVCRCHKLACDVFDNGTLRGAVAQSAFELFYLFAGALNQDRQAAGGIAHTAGQIELSGLPRDPGA